MSISTKTAYVWGPVSNFSASLAASLLKNGWHVHIPTKSALQVSLSPLDLESTARAGVEKALGAESMKIYAEHLHFLDGEDVQRGTTYDIIIFCGLPSNFDEARVSRSPWAADQLATVIKKIKGVPVIIVSSLWGGIQNDGVVPEEIEFERRKPHTHFEGVCQQYEARILKVISKEECKWHLVRIPLILGSTQDGQSNNFSGLYKLFKELRQAQSSLEADSSAGIPLAFNPDATLWMLPNDLAAEWAVKLVADPARPSICNLLSTRTILNQEWLHELAQYLGVSSFEAAEKDSLNLPGTLRSMLADNVQAKTRNLFEVVGRYNLTPFVPSSEYFNKVCTYAAANNWGQLRGATVEEPFSPDLAQHYFESFLVHRIDEKTKKALLTFKGGLTFSVTEAEECRWHLHVNGDGDVSISPLPPLGEGVDKSKSGVSAVTISIAAPAFRRLTSGSMMFEQALVTRALQISGPPVQSLKVLDFFRRFLRQNHYVPEESEDSKVLEKAGKSEG